MSDSEESVSDSEDKEIQGAIEEKRVEPSEEEEVVIVEEEPVPPPKKKTPSKKKKKIVKEKGDLPPNVGTKEKEKKFMSFYLWKTYILKFHKDMLISNFMDLDVIGHILGIIRAKDFKKTTALGKPFKEDETLKKKWAESIFKNYDIYTVKDKDRGTMPIWEKEERDKFKSGVPFIASHFMKGPDTFLRTSKILKNFEKNREDSTLGEAVEDWWNNCCAIPKDRGIGDKPQKFVDWWRKK